MAMIENPTKKTYGDFNRVYDHFNKRLFGGELPRCLITMQRRNQCFGYFSGERWARSGTDGVYTDEIALNPQHFLSCTLDDVLSTLVHEMVHLWQHHLGTKSRAGYHNKQWAAKMEAIGLIPSATGKVGGKKTGQQMDHYIDPEGRFAKVAKGLIDGGFVIPYVDRAGLGAPSKPVAGPGADDEGEGKAAKAKAASKTKYSCPGCQANAWGKPELHLICGGCDERLVVVPAKHRKTRG